MEMKSLLKNRRAVPCAVITVAIIFVLFYKLYASYFFYENDAFIEAKVIPISSIVSGQVSSVNIIDFEKVKKGQVLFKIDSRPYSFALENAKAKLSTAQQEKRALVEDIKYQEHMIEQQQLTVKHNQKEWNRVRELLKTGTISKDKGEQAYYSLQNSHVVLEETKSVLNKLKATLGDGKTLYPAVAMAKAAISKATFQLAHTTIRSPSDGYITRFGLNKGEYISAGEPKFALVKSSHWWVYARVKESDLSRIKLGDSVLIWVDMLPGTKLLGRVTGIAWGVNRHQASGDALTSVLPYLKQEENWIRLDQRFPVRIEINNSPLNDKLRVGASASIFIKDK